MELKIGDYVELHDTTNLDVGLEEGLRGTINSVMEDPEGNRYVMFQPEGTKAFFWMAEWRFVFIAIEDPRLEE